MTIHLGPDTRPRSARSEPYEAVGAADVPADPDGTGQPAPRVRSSARIHVARRVPLAPARLVRSSAASASPGRVHPAFVLTVLVAVPATLSALALLHQSLRLDEAQSLRQTSQSFTRMYQLVAQDVHVPLYHTLLRLWTLTFGNGVATARGLSLLLFLLTIPTVYVLGRRVLDERPALFAAGLVALSPFMTWYGNEIRMYALLTLLVVLNQLAFLRLFQRAAGPTWALYTVTALAGVYTHYFFWLTLMTQAVFFLTHRRRFETGTFARLLGVAALLVIALVPWVLFARSQGGAGDQQPLLAAPTSVDVFNSLSQFLFGFQDDHINTLLVSLWPLGVLLALLAVQKATHVPTEIGYFLLTAVLPILVAFTVSVTLRPIYVSRYMIITLPSLLLLVSWLLTVYGQRVVRVLRPALVAALLVASVHQAVSATTPVKEDYRAAAAYLASAARPQDVVVFSPPFTTYPFDYYWRGQSAVATLPEWNRFEAGAAPAFDPATLPEQVARLKANHEDAWLVLSYDQGYQKTIMDYFEGNFQRIDVHPLSPGLTVYRYRLRYDIPDTDALLRSLNEVPR